MAAIPRPDGTMDQVAALSIPLFICLILFILLAEVSFAKKAHRTLRVVLFVLYLFLNLYETVLFRRPTAAMHYNLTLFWSYRLAFAGNKAILSEILLNILLFVPFGFLLEDTRLKEHPWFIVMLSVIFSLTIELIQLFGHIGLFEFDDILNNTIGCVIGLGFRKLGTSVFHKHTESQH